jgi:hypothetical protein
MTFNAEQCEGISQSSGQRCKQPAVKGERYCRFHLPAPAAEAESTPVEAPPVEEPPPSRGAQPSNQNARKHGGYSLQLLPEEEVLYLEKREQFTAELGDVDVFDAQVIHILSLISCKLDIAAGEGAPAQVLIPISNEVLRLLRSLKETRDTRSREDGQGPRCFADFLEELFALESERGIADADEAERLRLFGLEREVNDLRNRLGLPPREDIGHRESRCGSCRSATEQRRNAAGEWVCLKCGHVVAPETAPPASGPNDSGPAGAPKTE